jgi:kinesin family member 5
MLVYGGNG